MSLGQSRRSFLKQTTAASLGAAAVLAAPTALGANDRIRVGVIGTANRGGQLITPTLGFDDIDIVALCDVDSRHLARWEDKVSAEVAMVKDFRRVLERDDIDAVLIATPDHWHAYQTIEACKAGKDVYVEKPCSYTIAEGRKMVEAARKYKRVVQVGLQRRSSTNFAELRERIQAGEFGQMSIARAYRITNMAPAGIGKAPDSEPPSELDWDMWLGPRAFRPFRETIAPYKFRWWREYSSQLGNWGVHYFDLIRWLLNEDAPASVSSHGGRFVVDDDRTIPDTLETTFEFASGKLLLFGQYEASSAPMITNAEFEMRGTIGCVYGGGNGYRVTPETGGQFQSPEPRMEPVESKSSQGNATLTESHLRNFYDCIRSRETPKCDIEEGHKSAVFAHLGNIALDYRSRVEWDAAAERVLSPTPANETLQYAYRAPWKLDV